MVTIKNASPQAYLLGIQDVSGRGEQVQPEVLPTHLPHVFIYAEKGPLEPVVGTGDALLRTFGSKLFDYRGPYANHQTVLLDHLNSEGNLTMVQRLQPEDAAPPATLAFSLDLLEETLPEYERNSDGTLRLNSQGMPIATGNTIPGYRGKWVVHPMDVPGQLGQSNPSAGTMVNGQGEQSVLYPMFEFEVNDFGNRGNLLGIRLWAPNTRSSVPVDEDVVLDQLAYIYRLQFVERPDTKSSPKVIQSKFGEQFINFGLKEGVVNRRVDMDLFADDVVLQSYHDPDREDVPLFGPFGSMHVYYDNLDTVLGLVFGNEAPYGNFPIDADARHMINLLSATDVNGNPYHTYQVLGPVDGGILFNEFSTHYAVGGSDGTMDFQSFDELVRHQMVNYGDLEINFLNSAVYPHSVFYDTGFSIDTKKAILTAIGRRKDVYAVLSTQDVSDRQNTIAEESSMAVALRAAARMYPESEIYGTPTCRAVVIGQSGYLANSKYKHLMPLTLEFAVKCARYMGAGNRIWDSERPLDLDPHNRVRLFRSDTVNCPFKPVTVRNRDWDNGLVWAQSYDRRSLFFPAYQTVYDDDTSVLNSAVNMIIAVELEKVADRAWRRLTGISSLTAEQFLDRSDRLIREMVENLFDGRVIVEPETYYTSMDEQRGYSWACKIHMYANNMKTVGVFTVVAHRREDYEA